MTDSAEQPLQHRSDIDEQTARIQLAALFRLAAKEGFHEAVANHFSYAISADGKQFLMNPYGIHFSRIRASDLLVFSSKLSTFGANPILSLRLKITVYFRSICKLVERLLLKTYERGNIDIGYYSF